MRLFLTRAGSAAAGHCVVMMHYRTMQPIWPLPAGMKLGDAQGSLGMQHVPDKSGQFMSMAWRMTLVPFAHALTIMVRRAWAANASCLHAAPTLQPGLGVNGLLSPSGISARQQREWWTHTLWHLVVMTHRTLDVARPACAGCRLLGRDFFSYGTVCAPPPLRHAAHMVQDVIKLQQSCAPVRGQGCVAAQTR